MIHTQAFELLVLKAVRAHWPKSTRLKAHVKGRV
jgi:hypothetical protein